MGYGNSDRGGRIALIKPAIEHEEQIMAYRQAFLHAGDNLDGASNLGNYTNYEDWLEMIRDSSDKRTVMEGWVPAVTFLAMDDEGEMVGIINIRKELNDFLFNFGGHIGYSIHPSERRKGYATEMLGLALVECRKLNLQKVLLTCDKENIASAKTIMNNGGILENEVPEYGRIAQRYWIEL